ncbi:hypothetical protein QS62_06095 [Gallibacterium salpingitidis]|uniref:DUF2262 domain-containing protein n=2 Tax=Gallibacterium salpingitidis TaxID=505341 RepID=A0A1A7NXK1_9PAST|nr:hypothetical protein QS62_06095 [Gallibacterium salpingitidis]
MAIEASKPKVIKDKELGTFKKVQGMDVFVGKISIEGKKVYVDIVNGSDKALVRLKEVNNSMEAILEKCRLAIYANLESLYDRAGVEPKNLTKEEWLQILKLKEIYIDENLDFHLYFEDKKQIFIGIQIVVVLDKDNNITSITL